VLPPVAHDPADVRERATDLLSRPPFVDERPGPVGRFLRTLGDLVADVLARLLATLGSGTLVGWVVVVVGTLLLAAVVWRLTRGMTADRSIPVVAPTVAGRTAADWQAAAVAAEEAGDRREALRCRYAALVATLVETGLLEDVPGRTVGELDREVDRNAPALAPVVTDAGERFERVFYGRRSVGTDDLEVVAAAAEQAGPTGRVVAR
jgi:hypothetical protein